MIRENYIDILCREVDKAKSIEIRLDQAKDGPEQAELCINLGIARGNINQLLKLIND